MKPKQFVVPIQVYAYCKQYKVGLNHVDNHVGYSVGQETISLVGCGVVTWLDWFKMIRFGSGEPNPESIEFVDFRRGCVELGDNLLTAGY